MISEFVCPCHGRMVDSNIRDPSRVILKYGKSYDGYWTGEDVAKQLEEFHVNFLKLHGGALVLYIFDNSANIHNIATDALNAKKLNLKDGGGEGEYPHSEKWILYRSKCTQSCLYNSDHRGISKGVENDSFGTRFVERWDE